MKKNKLLIILLAFSLVVADVNITLANVLLEDEGTKVGTEENIDKSLITEIAKLKEKIESKELKLRALVQSKDEKNVDDGIGLGKEITNLLDEFEEKINSLEDDNLKEEKNYLTDKRTEVENLLKELEELIKEDEIKDNSDKELNSEISKLYENLELKITKLENREQEENKLAKSSNLSSDEEIKDTEKTEVEEGLNLLNEKINSLEEGESKEEWTEKYNGLMKRFNSLAEEKAVAMTWADVQTLINSGETEIDVSNLPDMAGSRETGKLRAFVLKLNNNNVKLYSNNPDKIIKHLSISLKNNSHLTIENLSIDNYVKRAYKPNRAESPIYIADDTDNIVTIKGDNFIGTGLEDAGIAVNNKDGIKSNVTINGDGYLEILSNQRYIDMNNGTYGDGMIDDKPDQGAMLLVNSGGNVYTGAGIGGEFGYPSGDIKIIEDVKLKIYKYGESAGIGGGGEASGLSSGSDIKGKNGKITINGNESMNINIEGSTFLGGMGIGSGNKKGNTSEEILIKGSPKIILRGVSIGGEYIDGIKVEDEVDIETFESQAIFVGSAGKEYEDKDILTVKDKVKLEYHKGFVTNMKNGNLIFISGEIKSAEEAGPLIFGGISGDDVKIKLLNDTEIPLNININSSQSRGSGIGTRGKSEIIIKGNKLKDKSNINLNIKAGYGAGIGSHVGATFPEIRFILDENGDVIFEDGKPLEELYIPEMGTLNIDIENADIDVYSYIGAAIGSGAWDYSDIQDIKIKNSNIKTFSEHGAGIGGGTSAYHPDYWGHELKNKVNSGNILIDGGTIRSKSISGSGIGGGSIMIMDDSGTDYYNKAYLLENRSEFINDGTLKIINKADIIALTGGEFLDVDGNSVFTKDAITAKLLKGSDKIMGSHTFNKDTIIPPLEIQVINSKGNIVKKFNLTEEEYHGLKGETGLKKVLRSYGYTTNDADNIYTEEAKYTENGKEVIKQIVQAEPLRESGRHPDNIKEFRSVTEYEGIKNIPDVVLDNTFVIFDEKNTEDEHTVKFETNGGNSIENQIVKDKGKAEKPKDPTKDGYEFVGWYENKDLTGSEFDFNTEITSDKTLYAKWKKESSGGNGGSHRPKPDKDKDKEVIRPQVENTIYHKAYIKGYEDNTVRPQGNLTREEAAMIIYRILDVENSNTKNYYSDIENTRWSKEAINYLSSKDIIEGYPEGDFRPEEKITRAEVTALITRLEKKTNKSDNKFSDINNHWAKDYILISVANNWVVGYPEGDFRPNNNITRAEFVTMVNRMLGRKVDEEHILDDIRKFKDLNKSEWYYTDIVEASNSHNLKEKRLKDNFEDWISVVNTNI